MINDIIIEKNGNFLLDLTSEKNPIINVKKNVNITIDLLINDDTNLLTFFVQKYAKVMLRIFYKNSSEKLEILANLDHLMRFLLIFQEKIQVLKVMLFAMVMVQIQALNLLL